MDGAPAAEFLPTMTHGGRFLLYNIFGNQFEITSKYQPPIMPIGRGAYGIVWYVSIGFDFMPRGSDRKQRGSSWLSLIRKDWIRPITAFSKQHYSVLMMRLLSKA